MAIVIRLDIDRPYGRQPIGRHILSRISSDFYFPRLKSFGFLTELRTMLSILNAAKARSYVFFRRCTLPSEQDLELLDAGDHEIGLHLEDSRTFSTFANEIRILEQHVNRKIYAVSKHGSGKAKFGFHHHAPYEPHKYTDWARELSMRLFLGNLEDPTLEQTPAARDGLLVFPSAFWLEPSWRNTAQFTINWLIDNAQRRDIVLLVHPENVLADPMLSAHFTKLITTLESRIF